MIDDVGKREDMHEPRESEIGLAAVEHVAHVLPQYVGTLARGGCNSTD